MTDYRKLNEIPIPKRGFLVKMIMPDLYYIVWEKDILKPKVFLYAFADEYHALKFSANSFEGIRYNVLKGEVLLSYGIQITTITASKATGIQMKKGSAKYGIHPDLSAQRKKTLRNLYRRNQRRLLIKLLNMKNKTYGR